MTSEQIEKLLRPDEGWRLEKTSRVFRDIADRLLRHGVDQSSIVAIMWFMICTIREECGDV